MNKTCKACISAQQPEPSIWCARFRCNFAEASPACVHFELRTPAEEQTSSTGNTRCLADARKRFRTIDGGNKSGEAWRAYTGEFAYALTQIRRVARIGDVSLERLPGAIEVKLATAEMSAADLRRRLAEAEQERGKLRAILEQIQGLRTSAGGTPYAYVGPTVLQAIADALGSAPKPAENPAARDGASHGGTAR